MSAFTLSGMAQKSESVIKVNGKAEIKAVPQRMHIQIPLEVKNTDYQNCTSELTKVFNSLTEALNKKGIRKEDIKSDNLQITEDYKYMDRERVLIGYVGRISVKIEMDNKPKNLQMVMETLNDPRFKFGYNVSFSLSDAQKDSLLEAALTEAVKDASHKAEVLVKALGKSLGNVREVNYEYDNNSGPLIRSVALESRMDNFSKAEAIELNPEEITLTKTVGIIWDISDGSEGR